MKLAHNKQTMQVFLLHLPFVWRNWRKLWPYGKIRTRIHEPFLCCVGSATFVMGQSEILRDEARWRASVTYLLSQLLSTEMSTECGRVKDGCFLCVLERKLTWFAKDLILVKVIEQFEPVPAKFRLLHRWRLLCVISPLVLEKPSYWQQY